MKILQRSAALVMAAFVMAAATSGLFLGLKVSAATTQTFNASNIEVVGDLKDGKLIARQTYDIYFSYVDQSNFKLKDTYYEMVIDSSGLSLSGGFSLSDTSTLTLRANTGETRTSASVDAVLTNVTYSSVGRTAFELSIKSATFTENGVTQVYADASKTVKLSSNIPSSYFPGTPSDSNNTTTDDDEETVPTSKIVVENVILRDREGNQINGTIDEDSPAFTLEIVYTDLGMARVSPGYFRDREMVTYLTESDSFVPQSGNQGSVTLLTSNTGYPRFRVRFQNITYSGEGNSVGFLVNYWIYGEGVEGTGTAKVHQAKGEDEDDDEIPPPTPYVIVSSYSYGDEDIEAGQSFTLDLSYTNTSSNTALENIILTVTPVDPKNLSVGSASNTFYIDRMEAGASRSSSVEFQAKPAAEVGSHEITVKFDYEYVSKKERATVSKEEKIAIPISQIDRFDVDPITDYSEVATVGEEAYVTVSFINRGESTTKNISCWITGNLEVTAPSTHFGHLESGKTDSVDISFIPQEPGEFYGEVVVQYEDNTHQKEIKMPFTVMVEEPWYPPDDGYEEYPGMELEENSGSTALTVTLCSAGGLMLAGPIAMYLMKRVKAKASEDFDEDF